MKILRYITPLALTLALLVVTFVSSALAQTTEPLWREPVNLSRSGAASQPQLLVYADGQMQAFWWDQFDGLMSAVYDGRAWSEPFAAPITSYTLKSPPQLLLDPTGTIHALWIDQAPGGALLHSRLAFGDGLWSLPVPLAASAVAFQVALASDDTLSVAYLRNVQNLDGAAGVYFTFLDPANPTWTQPVPVHTSPYYRLLTSENAWLTITPSQPQQGKSAIILAWQDIHSEQALYAASTDRGLTWSTAQPILAEELTPALPRLATLPDGAPLLIWQAAGRSTCQLYQQAWLPGDGAWDMPAAIPLELSECPGMSSFHADAGLLYWLWGAETGQLTLAAWDPAREQWSEAQSLPVSTELEQGDLLQLTELAPVFHIGELLLLGSDPTSGDIWFTQAQSAALELAFPPPPPWLTSDRLSSEGLAATDPALVIDPTARIHLVWSEGAQNGPAQQILYARLDSNQPASQTRPSAIVTANADELARQPALLLDETGWLHMAWSGGAQGEILYSRAALDQAASAAAWSPMQDLSDGQPAAWPQLAADSAGRLYLLYVVPANEARGVYLTRSIDGGETWTTPEQIFDAAAAEWIMVGRPALAVLPSLRLANHVELHAAWSQAALPGTLPSRGIYYARAATNLSTLDPLTWPEPFEIAAQGYDAPRLVAAAGSMHLFSLASDGALWQRSLPLDSDLDDIAGWSTPQRVTAWQLSASLAYGLASAGGPLEGNLYLAGPSLDSTSDPALTLRYSAWENGRWAAPEIYFPPAIPASGAWGAAAAARPDGQLLALAWLALDESDLPALRLAWRALPLFALPPLPTPVPTLTPTPAPTLEPTPAPSPTPDLNQSPPAGTSLPAPLILGGGLAAIIVIGVFVIVRLGWFRKLV